MSREILEAIRSIETEKGIEEDTLIAALEDALLAAYKKTPEPERHAQVPGRIRRGDWLLFRSRTFGPTQGPGTEKVPVPAGP